MAFDPLKEIDTNRFYLDVRDNALVAVEAKRQATGSGGVAVWPKSALNRVVQFFDTHPLQEFLSLSDVLRVERVFVEATKDTRPACRTLFQKHILTDMIPQDLMNKIPKEREEMILDTFYNMVMWSQNKSVAFVLLLELLKYIPGVSLDSGLILKWHDTIFNGMTIPSSEMGETANVVFKSQLRILLEGAEPSDRPGYISINIAELVKQCVELMPFHETLNTLDGKFINKAVENMKLPQNADRGALLNIHVAYKLYKKGVGRLTDVETAFIKKSLKHMNSQGGIWGAIDPSNVENIAIPYLLMSSRHHLEFFQKIKLEDLVFAFKCLEYCKDIPFIETMLLRSTEERDPLLRQLSHYNNNCSDWPERIGFFAMMNTLQEIHKEEGMTENERDMFIGHWIGLEKKEERDRFGSELWNNYSHILKWLLTGLTAEERNERVSDSIACEYEKFRYIKQVIPLLIEGDINYNLLILSGLNRLDSEEKIGKVIQTIQQFKPPIPADFVPMVMLLLSYPEISVDTLLSGIPDTAKKLDSYNDVINYVAGLDATENYLDKQKVGFDLTVFRQWMIDLPEICKLESIAPTEEMITLPDRMSLLNVIKPYLDEEDTIDDHEVFFKDLNKMLKNSKPEEREDITLICLAAHTTDEELLERAKPLVTSRFPSILVMDEALYKAFLTLMLREGPIDKPIKAILISDPTIHTVELLRSASQFGAYTIEVLFGKLIQDIPESESSGVVLQTIPILKKVKKKGDFVEKLAAVSPANRAQVIALLRYFEQPMKHYTLNSIEFLEKTLPTYNALDLGKFFEGLFSLDRYVILQLLEKGVTEEQLQALKGSWKKIPKGKEWAFVALFLSGISPVMCLRVLHNITLFPASYGQALVLMHIFKEKKTTIDHKTQMYLYALSKLSGMDVKIFENMLRQNITPESYMDALFEFLIMDNVVKGTRFEDVLPLVKKEHITSGQKRLTYLDMFESRLQMEPEDDFLLLYKQAPIPPLSELNISGVPLKSPVPKPDLKNILDAIQPPPEGEVRENNQHIIDSTLSRKDDQWVEFSPRFFEELERYLEWVYNSLTLPEADKDNVPSVLRSFSESTRRCPADWKNEAEYQYSRLFVADAKDYIQSLAANVRRNCVGAVIQKLAKQLVSVEPGISYVEALQELSDNHNRNRIVSWLVSRSVPGSDTINAETDPFLPRNLKIGNFNPKKLDVVAIFDTVYTLRALCEGIAAVINDPGFTHQDILIGYLAENKLAATYDEETWQAEKAELLKQQEPVIVLSATDLTPLFNAQSGSPITSVDEIAVHVRGNPPLTLQMGTVRQFLNDRKGIKELQEPMRQWMANPSNRIAQKAFQEAFTLYEEQLEPRRKRDALKRELIPCKFTEKDDAALEAYLAGELSYKDIVELGIKNAQKDAFARSMIDPVTNKFKIEALFLMLLQAGIYEPRT